MPDQIPAPLTNEQLTQWGDDADGFPAYWLVEHDGCIAAMATELLDARAEIAALRNDLDAKGSDFDAACRHLGEARDQLAALLDSELGNPDRDTASREFLSRCAADAILAAGFRPPAREITDYAEFTNLPVGAVVMGTDTRTVWQRVTDGWLWVGHNIPAYHYEVFRDDKSVTVLYVPTEEATDGE
ncbi:hypothetical protein A5733_03390 [Mycobacterium sp. NS-7484]|uniref:hypothetical protein n=1 Tax=Mycobacterium sp. NS-7484 TaxID=1834161 RepID=UPI00096FA9BB|nr:hypothetical protein [Mycobacterium sp. NS-7484]OMC00895.1 hypothetical protein A5733_03390 [Mycobacterium sp. NS-7484]